MYTLSFSALKRKTSGLMFSTDVIVVICVAGFVRLRMSDVNMVEFSLALVRVSDVCVVNVTLSLYFWRTLFTLELYLDSTFISILSI